MWYERMGLAEVGSEAEVIGCQFTGVGKMGCGEYDIFFVFIVFQKAMRFYEAWALRGFMIERENEIHKMAGNPIEESLT